MPDGVLRCARCQRENMLDESPKGPNWIEVYCNACGYTSLYAAVNGKRKVEVPVAGENAPPGYGHGV